MGFFDYVIPGRKKNPIRGITRAGKKLMTGSPEKRENVSTLRPEQEQLYEQLINAGLEPGAGGAFGGAADYHRDILSGKDNIMDLVDPETLTAPTMRQYNEEIVPGISEQFAGMGSGGLSSSGFRNAQVQGATDLAERLGAIRSGLTERLGTLRANLRQNSAQGLANIGQMGLQPYSQNMVTEQGSEGMLANLGPAIVSTALPMVGGAIGGPAGAAGGMAAAGALQNWMQPKSQASTMGLSRPYGRQGPKASPTLNTGFQLPNFMQGMR